MFFHGNLLTPSTAINPALACKLGGLLFFLDVWLLFLSASPATPAPPHHIFCR